MSSTSNTCGKPNKYNRSPTPIMAFRDWSFAQRMIQRHKVKYREISEYSGVPMGTAHSALNFKSFERSTYLNLIKVRAAVEHLLIAAGVQQIDIDILWCDYDSRIAEKLGN